MAHEAAAARGSTFMRSHQLCAMLMPYLEDRYDLSVLVMPARGIRGRQRRWIEGRPRGGIYILTKVAVERMSVRNALALQAVADGVCFDYVDTPLDRVNMRGADIHLCTSLAQQTAVEGILASGRRASGKAMPLFHNADARLYSLTFPGVPQANPIYWASEHNGFLPDEVRRRVRICHVETTDDATATIGDLPKFNLHYAVRNHTRRQKGVYKPFTRGFVAALCRSNIIALRSDHDVSAFLGTDYPYLVDARDTDEITATLERASRNFGGPEWKMALDRMRSVAQRISPAALASQLGSVCQELGH